MIRLVAAFLCVAWPAAAQVATIGDIRIDAPMLRETPPNAPVAAGFLTLSNAGAEDDAFVSASVDAAAASAVTLHAMSMQDGVMTMDEVPDGIALPAGETVILAPGDLHLMIQDLAAPLIAGGTLPVTLVFARAGEVKLDFPVLTLAEIRGAGKGGMSGAASRGADE